MKCKKSTGDCQLQLKLFENGDVFEFCSFGDFSYLHKFENIENNHLSTHKRED